ncbi:MAG: DUF4037 domain-containing protein [Abitibacteriaceae bacterium]|nr:DUF4037 domain-containing protein [Abditibacteriaceae bacterium]
MKMYQQFLGFATSFECPHKSVVDIFTIRSFFEKYLAIDPSCNIEPTDWLTFPQQRLLEVTSGKVYYDGLQLEEVRQKFSYYPQDVWLYLLSCQWVRIS